MRALSGPFWAVVSFLAAASFGVIALLRPVPELPPASGALESALAQGFLSGFTMDPHEALAENAPEPEKGTASVERMYKEALILYVQQDVESAVKLLELAAKAEPANERVKNALARIKQEVSR